MRNPTPELLLRIAQGDAYAMAAEYTHREPTSVEFKELLDLVRYMTHPTYHKLPAGTYTDDTQMSIAVAELLVYPFNHSSGSVVDRLTQERFAESFFNAFERDKRDGYSRGFQAILEASTSWQDMVSKLKPDSIMNGACMRACPLGVIKSIDDLLKVAETQAKVTHDTWGGIRSAQAVALMTHYALWTDGEMSALPEHVIQYLPDLEFIRTPWEGPVQGKDGMGVGIKTAHAVCTLVSTQTSLRDIMRQVILWGGDTDSVAAVAWGIACPRTRDEILPSFLESDLEKGTSGEYGAKFLLDLGDRLMKENGG